MTVSSETPLLEITEGWTNTLGPFTLKVNDVPLDLTGKVVTIVLHRGSGELVVPGGTLTVDPDQTGHPGQVSYTPVAGDFTWEPLLYEIRQEYLLHFKVVDGSGKVVFFPNSDPAVVIVNRA